MCDLRHVPWWMLGKRKTWFMCFWASNLFSKKRAWNEKPFIHLTIHSTNMYWVLVMDWRMSPANFMLMLSPSMWLYLKIEPLGGKAKWNCKNGTLPLRDRCPYKNRKRRQRAFSFMLSMSRENRLYEDRRQAVLKPRREGSPEKCW